MKWSADEDKKSLVAAQKALEDVLPAVRAIPGFKSVQRVVCGGRLDFKVRDHARNIHVTGKFFWFNLCLFLAGYSLSLRRAFRGLGSNNLCTWGLIPEIVRDDWRNIRNRDPNFHSYDDVKAPSYPWIGVRKLDTIWQAVDCLLLATDLCPIQRHMFQIKHEVIILPSELSIHFTIHTFRTSIHATWHPPLTV